MTTGETSVSETAASDSHEPHSSNAQSDPGRDRSEPAVLGKIPATDDMPKPLGALTAASLEPDSRSD
jgi:hypothetical protein